MDVNKKIWLKLEDRYVCLRVLQWFWWEIQRSWIQIKFENTQYREQIVKRLDSNQLGAKLEIRREILFLSLIEITGG